MKRTLSMIFICLLFLAQGAGARNLDQAPDCSRAAGSLPNPAVAAGQADLKNPVEHVVVIMQENHSFDEYFGKLNGPQYYGTQIDGVNDSMSNKDDHGFPAFASHDINRCMADTDHSWDGEHESWDNGLNDRFVVANGPGVMSYYEDSEIPYYYALANSFATADRYFCSALTSTFPNRYFLYAASAFGHVENDEPRPNSGQFTQKTIFDVLDQYGISWKYYTDDLGYLHLFQTMWRRDQAKMAHVADYMNDLDQGTLPQVVFLDASFDGVDEHPSADVQIGEAWVASLINGLMASSSWKSSALFLTYDENGGFFDHVAPPAACTPDGIPPNLPRGSIGGGYDRYGFRVPFVLVSPYAKHHYVSHNVYDHTSILKFIETKFNLPALTARDANADGMSDLFNFGSQVLTVPSLPSVAGSTSMCQGAY